MALVKFKLEDGTTVYVESAEAPRGSSGLLPGGKGEHGDHQAISFDQSITVVRKMTAALIENLRKGQDQEADEIQINFGLKASGEVDGLVVARGGMEANFNVMLRWHSDKDDEKKDEEKKPVKEKKGSAAE
jgi:hypothetical protein